MREAQLQPELRLLLACARPGPAPERQVAVRQLLADGIDWTAFAQKAVQHGLTSVAAYNLAHSAPDQAPKDILDAFHAIMDETGRTGRARFNELVRLLDALAKNGIEAIAFKGPVLAWQTYGALGIRESSNLGLLVHDGDIAPALAALSTQGYRLQTQLTEPQSAVIRRLQGHEMVVGEDSGTAVALHTRLTSPKLGFDIDDGGLWRRAQTALVNGRSFRTLAPEDALLLLAIQGGTKLWRKLKWSCDFATFAGSHPELDWPHIHAHAQAQGCLRMLHLAVAIGRTHFHSAIPGLVSPRGRGAAAFKPVLRRIVQSWQDDKPAAPPSDGAVSWDRLLLHDGLVRQGRYVARTALLPTPHHVSATRLPPGFGLAYIPIKLAQDIALPLERTYRHIAGQVGQLPYALAGFDAALAVIPASAETKLNIRRRQRARRDAERVLTLTPEDPAAWRQLGDALAGLRRYRKAIACYDKALSFAPHHIITWKSRAAAIRAWGGAVGVPEPPPDLGDAEALAVHAGRLFSDKRFAEAIEASDRAIALDPGNLVAERAGIHARLCACDWRRRETDQLRISEAVAAGQQIINTFYHRTISDSEPESLVLARLSARRLMRPRTALWEGERYQHGKIRLAYCSTDFRDHVVSDVVAGCFEHHDKSRFETTAISLGPDDGSTMRKRITAAFDRFVDARAMTDHGIAGLLRELEIDIAVDLNGNAGDGRPGVFAHRPAPVQATFLGYPGTMGLPFYDYIISDQIVIPREHRRYYTECPAYLPHSCMPNDGLRPIAARTPSRADAGLPETGFIFACHNHEYKIGPETFGVWMRLLQAVDGSVLWLKSMNPAAKINLRREAAARGVAPERLVFAPHLPRAEDHLARLRLAGLFLDTRPYNAHATACDALWAGVPVVTCPGSTFPSRVAASVLLAIGMPELVTHSLAEYEALAKGLAENPQRLAVVKAKLMHNRDTAPLFDTARFTLDLESAFATMWKRQQDGLPPESFAVERAPACAGQSW